MAHYALVKLADHRIRAATDAKNVAWFSVDDTPTLAFDHERILDAALRRLKGKVRYEPIGFELLPPKFTLSQLQHLYEACLEEPLDKRNFRKKILALGLVRASGEKSMGGRHRPAMLYRFESKTPELVEVF